VHAENILRNVNYADQSTKCCLKITAHIRASSSSLDLATKINEPFRIKLYNSDTNF